MGGGISFLSHEITQKQTIKIPFKISHVIGKGGFALVYHAIHIKEKKNYAIKETNFLRPESHTSELDMTLTELEALKQCGSHPFIVKLHYAFREGTCCYLVLDPLLGGDLRYHLRNFQLFREHHVAYFIACIGSALHHLHERGILHRDVKPENVILGANGIPYLTDFGTAYLDLDRRIPLCVLSSGTLPYLAPEALTESRRHSYQVDFWSLGVMAYELLFNVRPFDKHCPKRFIYFVDNQYKLMWNSIETQNYSRDYIPPLPQHLEGGSNSGSSSGDEKNSNSSNDNVDHLASNLNLVVGSKSGPFDFEQVSNAIDESQRLNSLPYPQHQIPLLQNGQLPSELMVPIPMYSYCGDAVTTECRAMLSGLLDVRIPLRLGDINRFNDFSNHQWFQNHQFLSSHQIILSRPPFQPNVEQIKQMVKLKYSQSDPSISPHLSSPSSSHPLPPLPSHEFSPIVERKLSSYSFYPQKNPEIEKDLTVSIIAQNRSQDTDTSLLIRAKSRSHK